MIITIFNMVRGLQHPEISQKSVVRLNQSLPWKGKKGMIVHMESSWAGSRFVSRTVDAVAYAGPGRAVPVFAQRGFRLGEGEDRQGLVRFALATGATEVALGPASDRTTALAMKKAGLLVHYLETPVQLPLPGRPFAM